MRAHPRIFGRMPDLTRTAVGTWSGGRFMRFGEPLDDDRLAALLRPDERIATVLTADAYGAGEADALLGRALDGRRRATTTASSARSGTTSTRASARARRASRASPTRACAAPTGYARLRADGDRAQPRALRRRRASTCCCCTTPTARATRARRCGTRSAAVRDDGLTRRSASRPGPANGFTLDVIDCFERFGDRIDWAMVILNPLEPWPGELVLPAAERHGVKLITRVVDYGGLFHDDVLPGPRVPALRPPRVPPGGLGRGAGARSSSAMRPIAERHGLTMLQLACQWNLAHGPVALRRADADPGAGPERASRSRPSAPSWPRCPAEVVLSAEEVAEIRAIGDNTRLDGAQGRRARLRGRAAARPLAARRRAGRARRPLGHRSPARPGEGARLAPPRPTGQADRLLTRCRGRRTSAAACPRCR